MAKYFVQTDGKNATKLMELTGMVIDNGNERVPECDHKDEIVVSVTQSEFDLLKACNGHMGILYATVRDLQTKFSAAEYHMKYVAKELGKNKA